MTALETALMRLTTAIDGLDMAVNRLGERGKARQSQQNEIDALCADRSRLAQEIDSLKAEARVRETLARDAGACVARAMADVRAALTPAPDEDGLGAPD